MVERDAGPWDATRHRPCVRTGAHLPVPVQVQMLQAAACVRRLRRW